MITCMIGLNNLKRSSMDFILGLIAGITVTLGICIGLFKEFKKAIKDFDTWKEWKNKQQ